MLGQHGGILTALLFEDLGEEEYITEYPSSAAAYLALKKARGKAHIEVYHPGYWTRVQ